MDKVYPYNLTKEEVIRKIETDYPAKADPDNENFDVYDQLLACEAIAESQVNKLQSNTKPNISNANVVVSGDVNGGCKLHVKFELTQSKLSLISDLKKCNSNTPPIVIATLLEEFFKEWVSEEGHWLYVAQHWNPRSINRVLSQMVKEHVNGIRTFKSPPAYFTLLIKFRQKRKSFRQIK